MSTRRLTILAMLVALNIVLSIIAPIQIQSFKFTFEAFPILFAGLAYGPLAGVIVGGLGSLIFQIFFSSYGFTITTLLWVLPHLASGFFVGMMSKLGKFRLSSFKTIIVTNISSIIVTALNTFALFVDSKLFGYYSKTLLFSALFIKIICGIILAIIYSLTIPKFIAASKKIGTD